MMSAVLVAHFFATVYMTGLIWFVQIVHYPLKRYVGREAFRAYQAQHTMRTGYVVIIPMVAELITAIWLVMVPVGNIDQSVWLTGLFLVCAIWLSTLVFQIPAHSRLAEGFEAKSWIRLVRSNWIRTVCWSLRSFGLTWLLIDRGLLGVVN